MNLPHERGPKKKKKKMKSSSITAEVESKEGRWEVRCSKGGKKGRGKKTRPRRDEGLKESVKPSQELPKNFGVRGTPTQKENKIKIGGLYSLQLAGFVGGQRNSDQRTYVKPLGGRVLWLKLPNRGKKPAKASTGVPPFSTCGESEAGPAPASETNCRPDSGSHRSPGGPDTIIPCLS